MIPVFKNSGVSIFLDVFDKAGKKKMIIIIVVVRDRDLSALPLLRVSYQLLFVRTIGLADNLNSRYG